MKTQKLAMIFAVIAVLTGLTVLVGCTREIGKESYQLIDDGEQAVGQANQKSGPVNVEETDDKAGAPDELSWKKYEFGDYSFSYPAGWTVEISKKLNADDADLSITIKSTDKAVVLGGAAPDDYYVEKNGKNVVNSEKYAESFALISVDVYSNLAGLDWQALADKIHPNIVETFAPYSISGRQDVAAVKVDNVKGIPAGALWLFVKTEKAWYDVSLQYKNWDAKDAESILNKFFVQFPF